jgi:hypothetical protein
MSAASSSKALDGPVAMARWLKEGPPAAQMDIAKVKKLRMLLRQETTVSVLFSPSSALEKDSRLTSIVPCTAGSRFSCRSAATCRCSAA